MEWALEINEAAHKGTVDLAKADRRVTKATCAETMISGERCRSIARWRCQVCDRNTCADHVVRLSNGPLCANCKQPAAPLMRRGISRN
jgi:hypothetical protein